jgi:antitoxin (DNA-binding transcriptional repressor) of toxin-antitoxin stability system
MTEVSATDAARNFSDMLDAVEHRGERFAIMRRGKIVAQLEPVSIGKGRDIKALLGRHRLDPGFGPDVASVRKLIEIEDRP